MISLSVLEEAMYTAMKTAVLRIPPDIERAMKKAYKEETSELARMHLAMFFENVRLASDGKGLVCGDTGYPLYFLKAGRNCRIEGGFGEARHSAEKITARLTDEAYLRPTMVDPIRRINPGNNVGPGMPKVELSFEGEGDRLEIIAAPKGGGSEIFGTFYKMMYPSDGLTGIKMFVLDCIKDSCYAGKICPPAIIGVGIGGTADLCMGLAKKAALLRPIGSFNKDKKIAKLEKEFLEAARKLGIGPMGSSGINAVVGLHIETAYTHTAALPVAFNAQCMVGRRWKAIVAPDGKIEYTGDIA